MRSHLPNWIGWPGSGPAPGHDWLPGPALRFFILTLTYGFLALSLTVNYAASVSFFLLAIIGMYVGLRRGFVNGLKRTERLALLVFAAYPAVAIASYLVGVQTNVGFRFLGRDLRFLLFVPVFLAIRWSPPRAKHAGLALATGAFGALIVALLQKQPWPAPTPHGVTGTHISFGDLALLTGFLGAVFLAYPKVDFGKLRLLKNKIPWIVAAVVAGAGIAVSVLSVTRGAWLAIPPLFLMIWLYMTNNLGVRLSMRLLIGVVAITVIALVFSFVPAIMHRTTQALNNYQAFWKVMDSTYADARCVDQRPFLEELVRRSKTSGHGHIQVIRLSKLDQRRVNAMGCEGHFALLLTAGDMVQKPFTLDLYRGNGVSTKSQQSAQALARGDGLINLWWKGKPKHVRSGAGWQLVRVRQRYRLIAPLELSVKPGSRLWVVPIQEPIGNYALALANTSVGDRLAMWNTAWHLFMRHPLIGAGTGAFYSSELAMSAKKNAGFLLGKHEHAHNDYLTLMATEGVVGLLAFLGVLIVPLAVVWQGRRNFRSEVGTLPTMVLVLGFIVFGLTESMFVHSLVISWYVVASAVCMCCGEDRGVPEELVN